MTNCHQLARGPATEQLKQKLLSRIEQDEGGADLLAEDIIELIAVARNDTDGFKAAARELERMMRTTTSQENCQEEKRST